MAETAQIWLTRAEESWTALYGRAVAHFDSIATADQRRVAAYAFAASLVVAASLLQWIAARAVSEPQLWLFHVAIVLTAAYADAAATLVAILLSMLLARVTAAIPLSTALLFGIEGVVIGIVVLRMAAAIRNLRQDRDALQTSVRDLDSTARHGHRMDRALNHLDQASEHTILVLLDQAGRVSDWRSGATRLYGFESGEMVGTGAVALFDEPGRRDFPRLLREARRTPTRRTCRQVRAGGMMFEAEIVLSPLVPGGLDGFAMIVHDLTPQQARAAADLSTVETQTRLRGEIELAQRQLLTLQHLTDPLLNSLDDVQFVSELLDRLRTSIHAEGIALIDLNRHPRQLFCASEGIQCELIHPRPAAALTADLARTVMIHNDPAGVAEVSTAVWPDTVSSLIVVPLVRAGSTTAIMEVVNRTGRRATEWDIALVQVVAARIAGFLEDESDMAAARRAWTTASESSGGSRFFAESSLRLTLDDVSDDHESPDVQQR